ncbi:ABC transporter ATP-binding protein [Parasynechococcus marenigrum]|jgi:NitT/TauT family transport system ATP-binding protein|uniref:ABC-type quaternary amine transporter n=1 Tax=Parasynechococcus marenigrum (strain WH8102) TaxID=84588 RepID=Q7U6C1_PARMW|nr:ABC transporter ATP-binding protein [Parasynechococcus marenigrum]QNI91889.1 ABC-type nitrate/sulfonate/bicarbonate transport system/ ATPase component [Synechococcus sp. BOUM118]QNJ17075.1 ABC-type nitrate/sulfonate/bicarbonate transport system/ ATPase component [Synechococcus sp. A18-40]CAE07932.1 ABC transporter, nitrate-like, ATP binding component [Parasynechococcus marenigrum WH 8102]
MELLVQNLSKQFGDKAVLEDINFSMQSGEFITFVGSSGCGKSTLLRLIAGLDHPSGGRIHVDGSPVEGPGPDRGMVFQKYSLYPWLTAADNVAFGMRLQGMTSADVRNRTAYFLEVVGLQDAATKLPRELSGGMQQRVAIARALATNPSVLLLDEPFGALDLQIRETMQEFLLQLWQRTGLTVLLITHDVEEALVLAQRVHVLAPNPGRIIRSLEVTLNKSDLDQLRLSAEFLQLRRSLATSLRQLEPTIG